MTTDSKSQTWTYRRPVSSVRQIGGFAWMIAVAVGGGITLFRMHRSGADPIILGFLLIFLCPFFLVGVWLAFERTFVQINGKTRELSTWNWVLFAHARETFPLGEFVQVRAATLRRQHDRGNGTKTPHLVYAVQMLRSAEDNDLFEIDLCESPDACRVLAQEVAAESGLPYEDYTDPESPTVYVTP